MSFLLYSTTFAIAGMAAEKYKHRLMFKTELIITNVGILWSV